MNAWNQFEKKAEYTVEMQESTDASTLAFYKKLITIRNSDEVLKLPEKVTQYNNTGSVLIVKYSAQAENRWVIINLDPQAETTFELAVDIHGNYFDLFSGKDINLSQKVMFQSR